MKNFNQIYEEVYNEVNNMLETKRKNYRKKALTCIIGAIMFSTFIILAMKPFIFASFVTAIMCCTILPIVFSVAFTILFCLKDWEEYNLIFKSKVIRTLIKSYAETLEYMPEKGIPLDVYVDGEFEKFDRYRSSDYIYGALQSGYKIEMSEVHTENESENKDGNTTYSFIFNGLVAKIELEKSIAQVIKLRRNKLIKRLDKIERINMDSSEFEEIYDIYSENKIVTMQLLTADIMQMFIDFKEKYKIVPELTMKSNELYIRFETGNVFEAKVMKHSLDYDTLKKYYDIINFTLNITEKILKNIKETEI